MQRMFFLFFVKGRKRDERLNAHSIKIVTHVLTYGKLFSKVGYTRHNTLYFYKYTRHNKLMVEG